MRQILEPRGRGSIEVDAVQTHAAGRGVRAVDQLRLKACTIDAEVDRGMIRDAGARRQVIQRQ